MISNPRIVPILVAAAGLAAGAASQGNPNHACTWLGGSGNLDDVTAVAVAPNGDLVVAGRTDAADFPVTAGAFDVQKSGTEDAFVARLSPDCSRIVAATFLGGSSREHASFVHVAGDGSIWVGGTTRSPDFPTTPDAFAQHRGGEDAFAVRFDASLTTLRYATAFGNNGPSASFANDTGEGFVLDEPNQLLYVGGKTNASWNLPGSAIQSTRRGNSDFYVAVLDLSPPNATALAYATLLGGGSSELQFGSLTLGSGGVVAISGVTISSDFPTTAGAFGSTLPGNQGAIVAVLDTSPQAATRLAFSTYVGGSGAEFFARHAVDQSGLVHLLLFSTSNDLPLTPNALITQSQTSGDAYYAQIDPGQSGAASLRYGSWILTGGSENAGHIAWAAGKVAVFMLSSGFRLPVTPGAFMPASRGAQVGFVMELDVTSQPDPFVSYASHYGTGIQGLSINSVMPLAYDGTEVVVGAMASSIFPPVTANAAQLQRVAGGDGFVGRLELRPWPPAFSSFGSSCAGSAGTPQLVGTSEARLTRTLVLTSSGLPPFGSGLFFASLDRTQHQGTPLPFSLAMLGAPGCEISVAPETVVFKRANGNGEATLSISIPAVSQLLGTVLFTQYAALDLPANSLGLVTTNGVGAEVRW